MAQLPTFQNVFAPLAQTIASVPQVLQQGNQLQDQSELERASKLYGDDFDAVVGELAKRGRTQLALSLRDKLTDQRKSQAEAMKTSLDNQGKRLSMAASIASGITDEPSFQRGKMQIASILGPDLASQLGDTYDPQAIQQAVSWGSTETGRIQAQKNAVDSALQALKLTQEGQEKAPETFQKWSSAYGHMMSVANTPEEWSQLQQMAKQGGVPLEVRQMLPPDFGPEATQMAQHLAMSASERAQAETAAKNASTSAATQAETARHNRATEAQGAQTQAREERKFDMTYGAGVGEDGKPLPENPTARAIAEYRMAPPTARSTASGPGKALMDQVLRVNPNYDASKFPERSKMRIAFTSGPQGQTLNSLNTAIEHLDQFSTLAQQMGTGNFQPGNAAYNWMRTTFGDSAPTNFEGMRSILAGELASAFKKSGATDQEIESVNSAIKSKASPKQLQDYVDKIAIPALASKAHTFSDQWKTTMGEDDTWSPYTAGAKAVLSRRGVNPSAPTIGGAVSATATENPFRKK